MIFVSLFVTAASDDCDEAEDDSDDDDDDDDNLLANMVSSGMPTAKSGGGVVLRRSKSKRAGGSKHPQNDASKDPERRKSKSPRNSRVVPGVRIAELKLLPTSTPSSKVEANLANPQDSHDSLEDPVNGLIHRENQAQDSLESQPKQPDSLENEASNCRDSLSPQQQLDSLTSHQKQQDSLEGQLDSFAGDAKALEQEANRVADTVFQLSHQRHQQLLKGEQQLDSLASSLCSNISGIQPPSVMDSLISISEAGPQSHPG